MTSFERSAVYLAIGLFLGALLGLGGGRWIDRDREAAIQEIMVFQDRRVGYDVAAEHATIIQPREDPAKGE